MFAATREKVHERLDTAQNALLGMSDGIKGLIILAVSLLVVLVCLVGAVLNARMTQ